MKVHKLWAAVGTALAVLAPAIAIMAAPSAQAQTYSVLYSFHGKHGYYPVAGLIHDKKGNLYGTAAYGGACEECGVVFKLWANGKKRVLYRFTGGVDGGFPCARLARDSAGNLYGTTYNGGAYGWGVVFKRDKTGAETVLHSFTGGADGMYPEAGLVRDAGGNLYGVVGGGVYEQGVVYKLDTTGAYTVLYSFTGGADGGGPNAGVVQDSAGNLYGTTGGGGAYDSGVVFKLDTTGVETVLYSFTGGADGGWPYYVGVVRDSSGNLFGTTNNGGDLTCNSGYGCGTVFKVDATGAYTVLHSFSGSDGAEPHAGVVHDSAGNLYGTTRYGGAYGWGVVFKLDTTGTETVLHSFNWADGAEPLAGVVHDSAGNLYGTTFYGGAYGKGVAFKITPQ